MKDSKNIMERDNLEETETPMTESTSTLSTVDNQLVLPTIDVNISQFQSDVSIFSPDLEENEMDENENEMDEIERNASVVVDYKQGGPVEENSSSIGSDSGKSGGGGGGGGGGVDGDGDDVSPRLEEESDSLQNVPTVSNLSSSPSVSMSNSPVTTPSAGKRTPSSSSSYGIVQLESIIIPSDGTGIRLVEDDRHHHTLFVVYVKLSNGLKWIVERRYNAFRDLHDKLKKTNNVVKNMQFPKKHMFRSKTRSVVEQRRIDLQKYINDLLALRPQPRMQLNQFLEVHAHLESYERKKMRRKRQEDMEKMILLLDEAERNDLSDAFRRLCTSKLANNTPQKSAPLGTSSSSSTSNLVLNEKLDSSCTESLCISKNSFRRDILGVFPDIPSSFAMRIVKACSDKTRNDIILGEFLRFMAILRHGSMETKLTLVFQMCDHDHSMKLPCSGLSNLLVGVYGRSFVERLDIRQFLNEAFDSGRVRLSLDEFIEKAIELDKKKHLIQWMTYFNEILSETPDQELLDLQEEFNPIAQQKVLELETHFSAKEVAVLQDAFNQLHKETNDEVDISALSSLFSVDLDEQKIIKIFSSFGKHANESDVNIYSFVSALSIACRGTIEEKIAFNFKVFQTQANNTMSRDDLFDMLQHSLSLQTTLEDIIRDYITANHRVDETAASASSAASSASALNSFSTTSSTTLSTSTTTTMTPSGRKSSIVVSSGNHHLNSTGKPSLSSSHKKGLQNDKSLSSSSSSSSSSLYKMMTLSGSQMGLFADHVIATYGDPGTNCLTLEQMSKWSKDVGFKSGILDVLLEKAFRELSLRPQDIVEEKALIGLWHQPYDPDHLVEDDVWCLIELSWWNQWCRYVGWEEESIPNKSTTDENETSSINGSSLSLDRPPLSFKKIHRSSAGSGNGGGTGTSSSSSSPKKKTLTTSTATTTCTTTTPQRPKNINNTSLLVRRSSGPSSSSSSSSSNGTSNGNGNGNGTVTGTVTGTGTGTGTGTSSVEKKELRPPREIAYRKHFVLVKEKVYQALKAWYGGGPDLVRNVRSDGEKLVLCIWEKTSITSSITSSSSATTSLSIENNNSSSSSLQTLENTTSSSTVLEGKDEHGNMISRRISSSNVIFKKMRPGGSAGLSNLGNTCFMNSALQCLESTGLLTEYFLSGLYLDDVNRTSTLGLQGKLAEVYGKLTTDMWNTKQKAISPREFKKSIGKFNEAFRGNEQQDAQELLAFLLSGLSEDLNRITDKPYIEQPDSDGRVDTDLANEWWRNCLRREVSIIVALFTGQYKSLLTCQNCSFQSARFEPFTFMQVPLPEPTHHSITITLVFADGRVPLNISLHLAISATVSDLKNELALICVKDLGLHQVTCNDLKIAEVSGSMILGYKADNRKLSQIRSVDRLTAYQLDLLPQSTLDRVAAKKEVGTEDGSSFLSSTKLSFGGRTMKEFLRVGMRCEVRLRGQVEGYVPAVILVVHGLEYVDVQYSNGDEERNVPVKRLRERQPRIIYPPLVHRKLTYLPLYFKNPFRPITFGSPQLLRICPELTTGYELYHLVWQRVRRFTTSTSPPVREPNKFHIHEQANRLDILVGKSSSCGFRLRRVDSKGLTDGRTVWSLRSFGCDIPCNDEIVDLLEDESIAIDWFAHVFPYAYNMEDMKHVADHSSIATNKAIDHGPVPLKSCLQAFTEVEKINEGYCSSCRGHREMMKKLDIWRLPPIMVIHLKRFQYTQAYRRKLVSLVEFPVNGLQLAPYVAPYDDCQKPYPNKVVAGEHVCETSSKTTPSKGDNTFKSSSNSSNSSSSTHSEDNDKYLKTRPHRGYTDTNLEGSRVMETEYDLYAVVNHLGALGGGHYTAYAKNHVDGHWYFYDDERVRVIEESKLVTSAAYLLFYIRKDMQGIGIDDVYPLNSNNQPPDVLVDRLVNDREHKKCLVM